MKSILNYIFINLKIGIFRKQIGDNTALPMDNLLEVSQSEAREI